MEIFFIIQIGVLIFSVVLHEIGHGYAALALGDHTARQQGRLSLNPIHHIDPLFTIILPCVLLFLGMPPFGGAKPVPVNPNFFKHTSPRRGMLIVAAAGPLTNLALCIASLLIIYGAGFILPDFINATLTLFLIYNTILMMFNLIPIPPLDGSKILIGLLPKEIAYKWAKIEKYGLFIVFALLMFGAIGPFMNLCIQFALNLLPN